MKVLDLDMDYFMESIASTPFSVTERLQEDYGHYVWSENKVRLFLENDLGLSKEKKYMNELLYSIMNHYFFGRVVGNWKIESSI